MVLQEDLTIPNILLANDKVDNICDFRLAKTMHNYDIYKTFNKVRYIRYLEKTKRLWIEDSSTEMDCN